MRFLKLDTAIGIAVYFNESVEDITKLMDSGLPVEAVIDACITKHAATGARHVAMDEVESRVTTYERAVCEWGFAVCKYCGAAEGDWDTNETCSAHLLSRTKEG